MYAENTPHFIAYLNSLAPNSVLNLVCPFCKGHFERKKNVIQSKLGKHNSQQLIYCSHACASKNAISLQDVICLHCKLTFQKLPNQIKNSPNHFCSKSCAAKYNNAHKTKGNRRSKLENWLEKKLAEYYNDLEIIYNRKETINSELDIYIPSLQLAFELNGIFHYEPIYGVEKLASIQNNDSRKFQACFEKNIELVIIDTSGQKYFKEKTSQKYLEIIQSIIDLKVEQ